MVEKLRPTYTFTDDRIEQLKVVVPEAFADGKINWDVLRDALGEHLDDEEIERFGLFWPGKREARRLASLPSNGTLVPMPGEGVNEDSTRNIFIEGENLEVLKILLKSYAGRVKMIYIDPPYNTGDDHVYQDDFSDPIGAYLSKTGQTDEDLGQLTSNPRRSGRFHSNWLSMIYPRLLLARFLLRRDGALFVSIDDTEVHNLKHLMNEVFGEENFLAQIEWQKRYTRSNNTDNFTSVIDHILLYSRSEEFRPNLLPREIEADERYTNPDNDPRGPWKAIPFLNPLSPEERPNLSYEIVNPHTQEAINPTTKAWRSSKEVYDQLEHDKRIWWGQEGTSKTPNVKRFLSEVRKGMTPINFWSYEFAGHTDKANAEIKALFGDKVFDTAKPTLLIQRMLQIATHPGNHELVLDFFAGSASTAQAIMQQNLEDEGNRRFILVQFAEPVRSNSPAAKAGFATIDQIARERIRRAIGLLRDESDIREDDQAKLELGFKSLRLDQSHFRGWQDYAGSEVREYQSSLGEIVEAPLVEDWKREDVLTEIILQQGFPLDSNVTRLSDFDSNMVSRVQSDFYEFSLYVCLDDQIGAKMVERLFNLPKEDVFVCLDKALIDELKMRLDDAVKLFVI